MRILGLVLSAIVLCGLGIVLMVHAWAHWPFNWPSDTASVVLLREHRADFVRIVDMVREDRARGFIPKRSVRIDPRWGRPDSNDSQTKKMPIARFEEYARLFDQLGLRYGLTVGTELEVEFNIACIGLAVGPCSYKGIVYRPEAKRPSVVDSLEDGQLPSAGGAVAAGYYLKPIETDWYVYRVEFD